MHNLSLEDWQQVLQDIKEKRRHRLTGSEYKSIIEAVNNHHNIKNSQQLAKDIAVLLARHEGPGAKPPFNDPAMNRVFQSACQPVALPENAQRMQDSAVRHAPAQDLQAQGERDRRRNAPRPLFK